MTDLLAIICGSFLAGWILGRSLNLRCRRLPQRDPFTRWWRRSPYSCGAIWMAATQEDADKFRSRFIDPLAWEDPPEQFIRMDEGRVQRGNGKGGPITPKPDIIPKPQPSGGRQIPPLP